MKKTFRPTRPAFFFIYIICLISLADALFTLYRMAAGKENTFMASFGPFSFLIAACALCYALMYARTRVELDETSLRTVGQVMRRPEPGVPRAMFLMRQGDLDIQIWDKTFLLADLVRWGWCEDLGYSRVDQSEITEKSRFIPVHEIVFVLTDNRRCHLNAGAYTRRQVVEMVHEIRRRTGIVPTGSLADL